MGIVFQYQLRLFLRETIKLTKGKTMLIKTVLNRLEHFKSFIFGAITFQVVNGSEAQVIEIKARANSKPECPECGKRCKKRDTQPARFFEYVPIWAFRVFFHYAPRRAACPVHGVKVEYMPWGYGKEQMTTSYKVYLVRWARQLSWKETGDIFKTSWESVYRIY